MRHFEGGTTEKSLIAGLQIGMSHFRSTSRAIF